jgi:mannose-1-phosphate guanylyltransferase
MNALILAAGMGSRLGLITKNKQKCLLPVRGTPLLELWIDCLASIGIKKIFINTHHCADEVLKLTKRNKFSKNITILNENVLLGTGGTLINNLDLYCNDDLIFLHGDNFLNFKKFELFVNKFKNQKNNQEIFFWMLLNRTSEPKNCGVVKLKKNIVTNFYEKIQNPPTCIANSAVYILKKIFLLELNKTYSNHKYPLSFSDDIIPRYLGKIYGHLTSSNVVDIGTPDRYNSVK